jgi:hypothetical protein
MPWRNRLGTPEVGLRQPDVGQRPIVQSIKSASAFSVVEPRFDQEQVAQEPAVGGRP